MSSIHDRPRLAAMMRPGPKTHAQHKVISTEVQRLDDRAEYLSGVAVSGRTPFARALAAEQAERVQDRLRRLVDGWSKAGRPRG